MTDDTLNYDVLIIGAGPAGLSCAYRIKSIRPELSVCILEKGPEPGSHILSGCVLDPIALHTLMPDWKEQGAPLHVPVTKDRFYYMTEKKRFRLPAPPSTNNEGNYIISLGEFVRWLAEKVTAVGGDIFSGFAAQEIIQDDEGRVIGIRTGETGRDKHGEKTPHYQAGTDIFATHTVFAEGCRGHLSERIMNIAGLRQDAQTQTYAIGLKETWRAPKELLSPGTVMHSVGWPLPGDTYGGSFLYHGHDGMFSVGYVIGLDYPNPYLDPFKELQRFKTHPSMGELFEKSKRIGYGARALNEGGYQSIPKLVFPGGALIGCAAGFMNVPKIKGTHTAMQSAICLADAICEQPTAAVQQTYPQRIRDSFVMDELKSVRNIRPAFTYGRACGMAYAALDLFLLKGRIPFTFRHTQEDRASLRKKSDAQPIQYAKPDNLVTFDKLSSVALSGVQHQENQPPHLKVRDMTLHIRISHNTYDAPETRYCPAQVYEYVKDSHGDPTLQINASNCIHCKTCDIKDPADNIDWTAPEGGGGPRYTRM